MAVVLESTQLSHVSLHSPHIIGLNLHSAVDLGKITTRDHLWGFVADTDLETGWTPINELNGSLSLQGGNSITCVIWNDVTTVKKTSSHIFAVAWIAFDHLVVWFEASNGHFLDRVGLV